MKVFTMWYKIMTLHSVYSLYYSGENVNMVRLALLDSLLPKHSLRIHKCFDDAVTGLGTELYSGT